MRGAAVLAVVAAAAGTASAGPPSAPPAVPAWRLAPSAVAVYDETDVTTKEGKETRGKPALRTVYGHDLRDEGQYRPVSPYRADLPAVLGLRWPPGTGTGAIESKVPLGDAVAVAAKGAWATGVTDDGKPMTAWRWTFASGPPSKDDTAWIRDGEAEARLVVDAEKGAVGSADVKLSYELHKLEANRKETKTRVEVVRELRLREVRPPRAAGFSAAVDAAIEKGKAWLLSQQKEDGTFPPHGTHVLGTTALAALTLAECGVGREEAPLDKALSWIVSRPALATYERALCLMALERAYTPVNEEALLAAGKVAKRVRELPPDRRAWCEQVAAKLEGSGEALGSWGYPTRPGFTVRFDTSNTQYAALGMRAASRLGLPVKEATWTGLLQHVRALRERHGPRGSVALVREGAPARAQEGTSSPAEGEAKVAEAVGSVYSVATPESWASMACAGIACLELARHELIEAKSTKWTAALDREVEDGILAGWAWLDAHWGMDRHAEKPGNDWFFYSLYALERAGVFSRVRLVGGKDWYAEGAVQLLLRQAKDGSWDENGGERVTETCFALLFLKRATAPLTLTVSEPDGR
jgi:hypothetical protein